VESSWEGNFGSGMLGWREDYNVSFYLSHEMYGAGKSGIERFEFKDMILNLHA